MRSREMCDVYTWAPFDERSVPFFCLSPHIRAKVALERNGLYGYFGESYFIIWFRLSQKLEIDGIFSMICDFPKHVLMPI
jgi:hypothetical protein